VCSINNYILCSTICSKCRHDCGLSSTLCAKDANDKEVMLVKQHLNFKQIRQSKPQGLWIHRASQSMHKSHHCRALIITARCVASAVLAMALCLSVHPFVRLSVTSRCSTKTAKRRITQTTHDSQLTLVSWRQRSPRNSTGVTSSEGAECRWGGSKSATFDQ